jgi:hypothetical protein
MHDEQTIKKYHGPYIENLSRLYLLKHNLEPDLHSLKEYCFYFYFLLCKGQIIMIQELLERKEKEKM